MRVLLLGGTGALGEALALLLSKNSENRIYITSRKEMKSTKSIFYIKGNAKNLDFLVPVLEKESFDVVCDFMLYSLDEFKERLDILLSKTKRYVFFSSARVYAETNELIEETSPRLLDVTSDSDYLEDFEYSLFKAAEEDLLINSNFRNWTIIRPYKTYSGNRLQLGIFEKEQWINRVLREKKVVFIKDCLEKYTSLTYTEDTAYILEKIINAKDSCEKIYQIANPEQVMWKDVINLYKEYLGGFGKQVDIVAIDNYEALDFIFHNKYRVKYDGLIDRKFSDNTIQEQFGPFEWTELREGLKICVCQFMSENIDNTAVIDYRVEGIFDKLSGEREPIGSIHGFKNKLKYILYRYLPLRIFLR